MKHNQKIYGFMAAALLLLAAGLCMAPVAADEDMDVPSFPMQLFGDAVDANGNPLPVGAVITATVDGITTTYVVKEAGKIGGSGTFDEKFLINGKTEGSTVTFAVNGVETGQTTSFTPGEAVKQSKFSFDIVVDEATKGNTSVNPTQAPSSENKTGEKTDSNASVTQTATTTPTASSTKTTAPTASSTKTTTPTASSSKTTAPTSSSSKTTAPTSEPVVTASSAMPSSATQTSAAPTASATQTKAPSSPLLFGSIIAGVLAAGVLLRRVR